MRMSSLSTKQAVILELLVANAAREMYGRELVKASGGRLKRGTVYLSLQRMEEKGFIESREEPAGEQGDPPRWMFRVTRLGQRIHDACARHTLPARGPA